MLEELISDSIAIWSDVPSGVVLSPRAGSSYRPSSAALWKVLRANRLMSAWSMWIGMDSMDRITTRLFTRFNLD